MITIIIPVFNEQDNIESLLSEIDGAAKNTPITEVIYVDDASTDGSAAVLGKLRARFPMLKVLQHKVRAGQSAAFMTGARAASNPLLVFMDGDGQNDPRDIAKLYECYRSDVAAHPKLAVLGQRTRRYDNWLRRVSSVLANRIRSGILHDNIRDTGCSLKLLQKESFLQLPYFKHMHRFLPALLIRDHVHIMAVDVSHRARGGGASKYGFWERLWAGVLDLLGARWLMLRGLPEGFSSQELK